MSVCVCEAVEEHETKDKTAEEANKNHVSDIIVEEKNHCFFFRVSRFLLSAHKLSCRARFSRVERNFYGTTEEALRYLHNSALPEAGKKVSRSLVSVRIFKGKISRAKLFLSSSEVPLLGAAHSLHLTEKKLELAVKKCGRIIEIKIYRDPECFSLSCLWY